jgi:hypothetical protein
VGQENDARCGRPPLRLRGISISVSGVQSAVSTDETASEERGGARMA